jgi:hypothetical protein
MAIPLLRESIHRKSPMQSSRVAGQETFLPRSSGRVTVDPDVIPKNEVLSESATIQALATARVG